MFMQVISLFTLLFYIPKVQNMANTYCYLLSVLYSKYIDIIFKYKYIHKADIGLKYKYKYGKIVSVKYKYQCTWPQP